MGRWPYSKREIVENCWKLDVFSLNRFGGFKRDFVEGILSFGKEDKMGFVFDRDKLLLILFYEIKNRKTGKVEEREEVIHLTTTPTNLGKGGVRYWFLCPHCGRRVATLYRPVRINKMLPFRCRTCYNLTYKKQKEHDKTIDFLVKGIKTEGDIRKVVGNVNSPHSIFKIVKVLERLKE